MVIIPQLRLFGWKEIEELGDLRHGYVPACLSGCRLFTLLPLSSPDSLTGRSCWNICRTKN